jgi:CheY-like chemotaxis protein
MLTTVRRAGPARIILAEDDRTLARLTEIAIKRTAPSTELQIVHDGHQAIAAISENIPDLLLLDLYMPGKDGFEVLEFIRREERTQRVPVVMLSSSQSPREINRAYDLQVNAYVLKQTDFSDLCTMIDSILNFWLKTATLPHVGRDGILQAGC